MWLAKTRRASLCPMSRNRRQFRSCARESRVGLCRRKGKTCRQRCGRRKMLSRSQRVPSFRSTSTTLRARRTQRAIHLSPSRRRSLPTLRSQSRTETPFAVFFSSPTSRKSTRLATMIDETAYTLLWMLVSSICLEEELLRDAPFELFFACLYLVRFKV